MYINKAFYLFAFVQGTVSLGLVSNHRTDSSEVTRQTTREHLSQTRGDYYQRMQMARKQEIEEQERSRRRETPETNKLVAKELAAKERWEELAAKELVAEVPSAMAQKIWIPSWPRAGSTTVFHMVLAATWEDSKQSAESEEVLEDRGRNSTAEFDMDPPVDPGCWIVTPSGCEKRKYNAANWTLDSKPISAENRTVCEARRVDYNKWCNITDAAVVFIPQDNYTGSPIKRHFGLYEPCHKKYGEATKPDIVSAELENNCKEQMDRMLTCNFTGWDYLWGWSRPHTDITGVTAVGANPPAFNQALAERTCNASDLLVFKTVDDYGRNANDIIRMLDKHPNLKALVPVRDPRAIYASWKELPWDFPGLSLLKQICDEMAADAVVKHPRLRRIVFEKLISNATNVMERSYKWLDLPFGKAQKRWIKNTFDADCSDMSSDSKFYSCHADSEAPLERFKEQLTFEELATFRNYQPCVKTAEAYNYEF